MESTDNKLRIRKGDFGNKGTKGFCRPPLPSASCHLPSRFHLLPSPFLKAGFTLLELLIVIALIGLITAVAAPNFAGPLLTLQTKSAVKKVSAILRHARNQAVSTQRVQQVVFDFTDRQVLLRTGKAFSSSASPSEVNQIYQLPEKVFFYQAKDLQGEIVTDKFTFVFYPAGNCSGGEVTLAGKPGQFYAVTVDFVTGITEVL